MALTTAQRKFIFIDNGIGAVLFNTLLNAGIGWLLFSSMALVPLWGEHSIGGDLLASGLLLPLLVALIAGALIKKQLQHGKVEAIAVPGVLAGSWLRWTTGRFGLVLGLFCVCFAALPMVALLQLSGAEAVTGTQMIAFKAVWSGVLSVLVSPLVAFWSLLRFNGLTSADPSQAAAV
ncbi:hypothetical protein [uncultured Ferrimonas sp.]|uniref:hypothetical protein n=1 Tax=uncultured Ferrimonas sp. TaxID=432640 RepID=UPI002624A4DC|nr:hypothetical protein [uncultured Ferrimonas sp.]